MHNATLRGLVAAVDHEMSALAPPAATALLASWTELVKQLALGPAPDLRECTSCHKMIMRAATLCGHCWTKLSAVVA